MTACGCAASLSGSDITRTIEVTKGTRDAGSLSNRASSSIAAMAMPALESALRRQELDLEAREAKGNALWFQGRLDDAAIAFEKVLQAAPGHEKSLLQMASLTLRLHRLDSMNAVRLVAHGLFEFHPRQALQDEVRSSVPMSD